MKTKVVVLGLIIMLVTAFALTGHQNHSGTTLLAVNPTYVQMSE